MSASASRTVKDKVIAGQRYKVTLLGSKAGRAMLVRLVKLLGPATAAFIEGTLAAKGGVAESIVTGMADAIREISSKITEADFAAISDEFARFTVVVLDDDREPQLDKIFEDHFAGRYDVMMQWFGFALEANFASFFGDSASVDTQTLVKRALSLIAQLSRSPQASTGTSGASPAVNATARA